MGCLERSKWRDVILWLLSRMNFPASATSAFSRGFRFRPGIPWRGGEGVSPVGERALSPRGVGTPAAAPPLDSTTSVGPAGAVEVRAGSARGRWRSRALR